HDLLRNIQLVSGDTDMADLTLTLRLFHAFIHSRAVSRSVALIRTVELIQVYVICAEIIQRRLQMSPKFLRGFRPGFCGNIYFIAHSLKSFTHFFLAVAVGSRRIKKAHAALVRPAQQLYRIFSAYSLDRQRSESVLRHCDPCFSQCNLLHKKPSSIKPIGKIIAPGIPDCQSVCRENIQRLKPWA